VKKFFRPAAVLLALVVISERDAHALAYTDPGSGALLWQLAVSGFLGLVFYFSRARAWIARKLKRGDKQSTPDDATHI
jgi:hypothetical protein